MRNLVPQRVLARRSQDFIYGGGLLVVIGIVLDILGIALAIIPLQVPSNPGYGTYTFLRAAMMALGAVLILVGIGLIVRGLTWKQENPLAEQVGAALKDTFDDNFVFIRNVSKLSLGYIDAVLIGPPGVLVLRITNREGVFFNDATRWMRLIEDDRWSALDWSPTEEVQSDMRRLRQWMNKRGIHEVPMHGAILFVQEYPLARINQKPPVKVPAVHIGDFRKALEATYLAEQTPVQPQVLRRLTQLILN